MYLLRNAGRYQPEKYRVVRQHHDRMAVRVSGRQCLDARAPEVVTAAVEAHTSLPAIGVPLAIGEFQMTVSLPEVALRAGNTVTAPDTQYVEATVDFPIRDTERGETLGSIYFPGVLREFADFLTVASNSYVIARLPIEPTPPSAPLERHSDRPTIGVELGRSSMSEEHFDLSAAARYSDLLTRFLQMDWHRHAALLDAFRCYRLALGFSPLSPSTAYFLLVAAVEGCAVAFTDAEPSFDEFPQEVRRAIQDWAEARAVAQETLADLRERLLAAYAGTLRAGYKFRRVLLDNVPAAFWEMNDWLTITPENLNKHLREVYSARSKFAHEAREFGAEVETPTCDILPVYAYDLRTGEPENTCQGVPTLDFFAKLVRTTLLALLENTAPGAVDDAVDPEKWLIGRSVLLFPREMLP